MTNDLIEALSGAERDLLDKMRERVAAKGLDEALRHFLPEAINRFHGDRPTRQRLAQQLYGLFAADPALKAHFASLSPADADALRRELTAAPAAAAAHVAAVLEAPVKTLWDLKGEKVAEHGEVRDGARGMWYYPNRRFRNWGLTVTNTPSLTFIPRTKQGVCNLVQWAKSKGKRVRVAGYRHTWGEFFSEDDQILVSLLPLKFVDDLPALEPELDPTNELQGIEVVGEVDENGVRKALCRIGAATTNEMFRQWCVGSGKSHWKQWTLPLNVIMVEITFGGSNGPICHGAGRTTQTLSDLVAAIEFVNAKGELQTVSDPSLLKAAAGCFGLLGVVTAVTLKLDPMSYATMRPVAPRLPLTIPPPAGAAIPAQVDMHGITPADLEAARLDFVRRCEEDYYAEWFWFAFQDRGWVNTWKNDGSKAAAVDYPNELVTLWQQVSEYLGQVANTTIFRLLPGRVQAQFMGSTAMGSLPVDRTIVTPLIDALHFQRGIQNMRVWDMEFEIPIPARADDPTRPDWSVCQRAWWDVIARVYGRDDTPMRLTMEMRITKDSAVVMAPQYGNRFGTCSIEILTTPNVDYAEWLGFMQETADVWSSYQDAGGVPLNVRPHWAKQWQDLEFHGVPAVTYLKTVSYGERVPEFRAALNAIATAKGYTLADVQARFSNALFDDLFEAVFT